MRNNSQNAGCMRRSPASHCCHTRQVVCTTRPAAVCESPAASRAARISAGAGFEEGPFGPRFGWLPISDGAEVPEALDAAFRPDAHQLERAVCAEADGIDGLGTTLGRHVLARRGDRLAERAQLGAIGGSRDLGEMRDIDEVTESGGGGGQSKHLKLQPLSPEARYQQRVDSSNDTRNARNVNNYLQIFSRRRISPHNASLTGAARVHAQRPG